MLFRQYQPCPEYETISSKAPDPRHTRMWALNGRNDSLHRRPQFENIGMDWRSTFIAGASKSRRVPSFGVVSTSNHPRFFTVAARLSWVESFVSQVVWMCHLWPCSCCGRGKEESRPARYRLASWDLVLWYLLPLRSYSHGLRNDSIMPGARFLNQNGFGSGTRRLAVVERPVAEHSHRQLKDRPWTR
jgi:hypothetical protein